MSSVEYISAEQAGVEEQSPVEVAPAEGGDSKEQRCLRNAAAEFDHRMGPVIGLVVVSQVGAVLDAGHCGEPRLDVHQAVQAPLQQGPGEKPRREECRAEPERRVPVANGPHQHPHDDGQEDNERAQAQKPVSDGTFHSRSSSIMARVDNGIIMDHTDRMESLLKNSVVRRRVPPWAN